MSNRRPVASYNLWRSSSEFLPAFSACPRRTAKDCKLQFFSISLVSPTYENRAHNSFLSPTYAKTRGWPGDPTKFLKSYLQCRNFDILAFFPAFLHFLGKSCRPVAGK